MKKHICWTLILILTNQCLYSQENLERKEFALDVAHRYTPINPSFLKLLDTLSSSQQDCIFNNVLGRDYFFDIEIYEDGTIRAQVYPYLSYPSCTFTPIDVYRDTKKGKKGFFYYNGKLVLVTFKGDHWYQLNIEEYFSRSYCMEAIMFSVSTEILPEVGMGGTEVATVHGTYDPVTGKLLITESLGCGGKRCYTYTIREGDTWESVAKKFATTVDNVRTKNGKDDGQDVPEKGRYIDVCYKIVDGVWEAQRIRTRFDP